MKMKIFTVLYSLTSYMIGVIALTGLILFIADLFIPVTVNTASPISPVFTGLTAIIWNVMLIALWGLQHSVMADPFFKEKWTKIVHPAIERSTYLLAVAITTVLLIALWSPIPVVLWDFSASSAGTILLGGYFFGWTVVLFSTFLINHFHLFGLEQAYRLITETQSKEITFVTPLLYRIVRHPMMTGILIALWCAPTMTVGRLLFNVVMTAYIIIGTRHEEKTLIRDLGEKYVRYRNRTPMLIPRFGKFFTPEPAKKTRPL